MNFKEIWEGHRNNLFPPAQIKEFIQKTSEERLAKCLNCPFNSTPGKIKVFSICKACGCPLTPKSKCLSCTCGISLWNVDNPTSPLEVQWEAISSKKQNEELQKLI